MFCSPVSFGYFRSIQVSLVIIIIFHVTLTQKEGREIPRYEKTQL